MHTDEYIIPNLCTVDDGAVTNRDIFTQQGRAAAIYMNDGAVLHIAALADDDFIAIATQDGTIPDSRILHQRNITDDGSGLGHKGTFVNIGHFIFKLTDHGFLLLF